MQQEKPYLIFDGECKLCQGAVRFLSKDKSAERFSFVALQDSLAEKINTQYKISKETSLHSVILIRHNRVYTKSTAVIKALQEKGGFWYISGILLVIPPFIRNLVYDWVAKNRNRLKL
jgi:predicted DCC family thiol-disulfide oxidoreductase YuxK